MQSSAILAFRAGPCRVIFNCTLGQFEVFMQISAVLAFQAGPCRFVQVRAGSYISQFGSVLGYDAV